MTAARSELSSPLPSPSSGVEAARELIEFVPPATIDELAWLEIRAIAVARALITAVEALEKVVEMSAIPMAGPEPDYLTRLDNICQLSQAALSDESGQKS